MSIPPILDKILRLSAAASTLLLVPIVLIIVVFASAESGADAATIKFGSLAVGGCLVLFLLHTSFRFWATDVLDDPDRTFLQKSSLIVVYVIGATVLTCAGYFLVSRLTGRDRSRPQVYAFGPGNQKFMSPTPHPIPAIQPAGSAPENIPADHSDPKTDATRHQANLENMANRCGRNSYNLWLEAQEPQSNMPLSPDVKDAKLNESINTCRAALGLAAMPVQIKPQMQSRPLPTLPPMPTSSIAAANANADREIRMARALVCEREESQKLASFWSQRPDADSRAAKLNEIRRSCLDSAGVSDSTFHSPAR